MPKAALHSLGCKVNSYETEVMEQMLVENGYEIVPFHEKADVYVINTCTVTSIADSKSRQMLHRARKENPDAIVVACGCYVQTGSDVLAEDPAVDIIIGNNRKNDLIREIDNFRAKREKEADIVPVGLTAGDDYGYEEMFLAHPKEHTRAFLKIQDGCSQFCTYCLIPYARGRARSRRTADVLREIRSIAAGGCHEIVLNGIHLSSFGYDTGESLAGLIEAAAGICGIERIRLGSLEPEIVDEDFTARLGNIDAFCPHFHLSLQSGCDATLRRMNRHYTAEEYRRSVDLIRQTWDHPAITTDVIAGFPGETDAEFQASYDFCREIRFYEMHVFRYSRRKGTKADEMMDQVPEEVKAERSAALIALAKEEALSFRQEICGTEQTALMEDIETTDGVRYWKGYTKEYVRMAVPAAADLGGRLVSGRAGSVLSDGSVLLLQ